MAEQNLQLQEGLANAAAYISQLQRILWLTVQAAGGQVTLDESTVHPLWRLDKIRQEDKKLVLTSSVTPPPNGEELDRLVDKLRATSLRIEDVQKELGLDNWPAQYLVFMLAGRPENGLIFFEGRWIDSELAKAAALSKGNN